MSSRSLGASAASGPRRRCVILVERGRYWYDVLRGRLWEGPVAIRHFTSVRELTGGEPGAAMILLIWDASLTSELKDLAELIGRRRVPWVVVLPDSDQELELLFREFGAESVWTYPFTQSRFHRFVDGFLG